MLMLGRKRQSWMVSMHVPLNAIHTAKLKLKIVTLGTMDLPIALLALSGAVGIELTTRAKLFRACDMKISSESGEIRMQCKLSLTSPGSVTNSDEFEIRALINVIITRTKFQAFKACLIGPEAAVAHKIY
ncbi:hypothetical protein EV368DRAFT_63910 [Lentinula lateritia]|uniref:Uncharacterized protein n=1 Tax=Lentinula aff. lateritia TaxID=2804960 RepID=A0ACC1U3W0_9AGAR|nr:hypothetical protein F5876DRAFT_64589 [Lentinula aff. lateritia]KAJ3853685.1 hypothetical protein EV368DRAFT_63910 [Lentinula lateritia]